jgi:hypothetical protein
VTARYQFGGSELLAECSRELHACRIGDFSEEISRRDLVIIIIIIY